jgi:8-oxo-dGTP diphosphatase
MSASRDHARPSVTVDVVVVASAGSRRNVLLVKRQNPPFEGCWALPGGFVEPDEPLEDAARRELEEETGILPAHLEQLYTFGDPGRDPRGWTISVAYLAPLTEEDMPSGQPRAGSDAEAVSWFPVDHLPPLAFDHADILAHALRRLKATSQQARSDPPS